jgi:hypothetical protein
MEKLMEEAKQASNEDEFSDIKRRADTRLDLEADRVPFKNLEANLQECEVLHKDVLLALNSRKDSLARVLYFEAYDKAMRTLRDVETRLSEEYSKVPRNWLKMMEFLEDAKKQFEDAAKEERPCRSEAGEDALRMVKGQFVSRLKTDIERLNNKEQDLLDSGPGPHPFGGFLRNM